jgi:3-oxoacyl-[acyl-carrier protein] reductase
MRRPTAVVTGASSGIGRAIALRLSRDGFHILVHYNRGHEGAAKTVAAIRENGGSGDVIQFDITKSNLIDEALNTCFRQQEQLDLEILINNAGIHSDNLTGLMSDEAFETVVQTNINGSFFLMRWCVRNMMRRRSGIIVNISSLSGQVGNPGQINYAASKAALIAMTKTLACEVGSRGIRVNAVAPGLIDTGMIADIPNVEELKKRIPLGRIGSVEDVAGAVSFLCSADASYVTGTTLSVNGGLYPA